MHKGMRIGVLALGVAVTIAAWGVWSGSCADTGECLSGPALGVPGAVVVTAVAVGAMWWAVLGLVRQRGTHG